MAKTTKKIILVEPEFDEPHLFARVKFPNNIPTCETWLLEYSLTVRDGEIAISDCILIINEAENNGNRQAAS